MNELIKFVVDFLKSADKYFRSLVNYLYDEQFKIYEKDNIKRWCCLHLFS